MRLRITTPVAIVVDRDVVSVRAEDASGGFGILKLIVHGAIIAKLNHAPC